MFTLLSLVVCLAGQPEVCETVTPDYAHHDTGQPASLHQCMGHTGQAIARQWLADHPGYLLRRIQCSIANDPERLRDQIESPRA